MNASTYTRIHSEPPIEAGVDSDHYKYMRLALEIAESSSSSLSYSVTTAPPSRANVGVVVVDPATGTLVAQTDDRRHHHPLHHAVMACVSLVGDWHNANLERIMAGESSLLVTSYNDDDKDEEKEEIKSGAKRTASQASLPSSTTSTPCTSRPQSPTTTNNNNANTITTITTNTASTAVGYLCTGFDAYISREPCIMCCMGLLHSRIARVFIGEARPGGGLGSLYKLHANPALNHSFKVYRLRR